ncbi:hypothetical protein Tco_0677167 [Tanacetum coccineum]
MSAITDNRCVLTHEALDAFCNMFHILEEVHPVLPKNDTMHERPAGKIRLYTRFFDFVNFGLPLSTFLVDILRYFRINISQLSVIGAAKVSHFEILCRVYAIVPTVGLFRCFYVNLKKSGWISFSKRSNNACNVTKDPAPVAAEFNAEEYATLVAHPSPFWKFPEEFLCLVGLSRHYTLDEGTYPLFLDKNAEGGYLLLFVCCIYLFYDPTKVRVVERALNKDEPLLLHTTVGRTVPLLSVAPDRAESELEASVDMHFDEGGSGNQTEHEGSTGSGRDANIQLVSEATDTVAEDMVPLQPRRQRKRKTMVADAGEASHPPKKLRLLAGAVLNLEVRFAAMPTLPFITSFVSATPEHECGDRTDSVTRLNLHTIRASERFVISSDSSHHSSTNVAEAEVDSLIRSSISVMTIVTNVTSMIDPVVATKEKPVEPLLFVTGSSSADGTDPTLGGFLDLTGSDFLIGGTRTVIDPDSDLQKVYVPQ